MKETNTFPARQSPYPRGRRGSFPSVGWPVGHSGFEPSLLPDLVAGVGGYVEALREGLDCFHLRLLFFVVLLSLQGKAHRRKRCLQSVTNSRRGEPAEPEEVHLSLAPEKGKQLRRGNYWYLASSRLCFVC